MASPRRIWLPRELIDLITDYLEHDRETLKSCCLLGPLWAASARSHIFYTFTAVTARRGRTIAKLLKLLHTTPTITQSVRELCIPGSPASRFVRTIDAHAVSTLLEMMPQLRVLSLQYLDYGENPKTPISPARFKLSILRLRCRRISNKSRRTFTEVLSLFSELGELHLQEHPYITPSGELQSPINDPHLHRPKIRAVLLECRQYRVSSLLQNYLHIPATGLNKLSVPMFQPADCVVWLSPALRYYGPHLEELEMQIARGMGFMSEASWRSIVDPAALSGILTISFVIPYGNHFGNVLSFLSILPSGIALRNIHLVFADPVPGFPPARWLQAFDIRVQRFASLRSVSLWHSGGDLTGSGVPIRRTRVEPNLLQRQKMQPKCKRFVTNLLPWLNQRGLLYLD